jgi:hypothetical protein
LEDKNVSDAHIKRKFINKKLILIIIIDILFIIGVIFIAIKLWPNKTNKKNVDSFNDIIYSLNIPEKVLQNITKTCDISDVSMNVKINCGSRILIANRYLAEAKSLCEKIEDTGLGLSSKTFCLSLVVAQTNETEGIEMCNDLNYTIAKNICLDTIHYFTVYGPYESICNKLTDDRDKDLCTTTILFMQQYLSEASKCCQRCSLPNP